MHKIDVPHEPTIQMNHKTAEEFRLKTGKVIDYLMEQMYQVTITASALKFPYHKIIKRVTEVN